MIPVEVWTGLGVMNLPLDTDRTRYDNPVPGPMSLLQREVSTVAEVGRAQIVFS